MLRMEKAMYSNGYFFMLDGGGCQMLFTYEFLLMSSYRTAHPCPRKRLSKYKIAFPSPCPAAKARAVGRWSG